MITGPGRYFEDYSVGQTIEHRRGRTVSQEENAVWSLATMNTAQSHWNHEEMRTYLDGAFDRPIVNAAVVIALGVGLTSQDMSENILSDIGLDAIRISTPVFGGDTLRARSVVLSLEDAKDVPDCGRMRYGIAVRRQGDVPVLTLERIVLIKRRSHWATRDDDFAGRFRPALTGAPRT